jgi:4-amino-4-deoxychorismate lyase
MQAPQPSLIETMHADGSGCIALLPGHLRRLEHSAHALGYAHPGNAAINTAITRALNLARAGAETATHTKPTPSNNWRVRLLLSIEGEVSIETAVLPALQAEPLIALTELRLESSEFYLQHKTTHRPWYEAATQWLAKHPDYFDLIFLNEKGELCEGSRSNIYVFKEGVWYTPPLSSGLLGGVLRTELIESGQAREAILQPLDLAGSTTRIRLSNALRGWFDVRLATHASVVLPD